MRSMRTDAQLPDREALGQLAVALAHSGPWHHSMEHSSATWTAGKGEYALALHAQPLKGAGTTVVRTLLMTVPVQAVVELKLVDDTNDGLSTRESTLQPFTEEQKLELQVLRDSCFTDMDGEGGRGGSIA